MTEKSYTAEQKAVAERFRHVRDRLTEACVKVGRDPAEVTLMGVTKMVPPERIAAAVNEGLSCIGENYVQEYLSKANAIPKQTECHFIGHLQTNKAKQIVGKVHMIQSVDSIRLAEIIDRLSEEKGIQTPVLVEINIGNEESKSGVSENNLMPLLEEISKLSHISVRGLMIIPPVTDSEVKKRQVFSKTHQLFIDIRDKKIHNITMQVLSMGMSADYELAVAHGSTMVRVGTAIFGDRKYPTKVQSDKV